MGRSPLKPNQIPDNLGILKSYSYISPLSMFSLCYLKLKYYSQSAHHLAGPTLPRLNCSCCAPAAVKHFTSHWLSSFEGVDPEDVAQSRRDTAMLLRAKCIYAFAKCIGEFDVRVGGWALMLSAGSYVLGQEARTPARRSASTSRSLSGRCAYNRRNNRRSSSRRDQVRRSVATRRHTNRQDLSLQLAVLFWLRFRRYTTLSVSIMREQAKLVKRMLNSPLSFSCT